MPKWSNIRNATLWPNFCQQFNIEQYEYLTKISTHNISEDCLYLNIWSPNIDKNNDKLKSVMVYIHGGVFVYMGISFDIFNGGVIAALGDVVFVTINYRLGIFGFLHSGIEDQINEPKNVGIYDQIMALNWIKNNAKLFGGNE